jgi:hypothetical protein
MAQGSHELQVHTGQARLRPLGGALVLVIPSEDTAAFGLVGMASQTERQFTVSEEAHGHIAHRCQIPRAFYQRLLDKDPALLAQNVNRLWDTAPEWRTAVVRGGELLEWRPGALAEPSRAQVG